MLTSLISSFWQFSHVSPWGSEVPIREELFSVDRLEQHAETLAIAQTTSRRARRVPSLVRRLNANSAILLHAHKTIAHALDKGRFITPAAEWLVDNYHVVAAQVREVQTDLPDGYYRLLPKLADGPFAGYPRVFGIAWAFVAHTDSHFDPIALKRFIHAYQRISPLTIGELWAIAITLRIVLVENLRRSAVRILAARAGREEADILADRLLGAHGKEPETVSAVLGELDQKILPSALAVQLVQRLRDQDPRVTPALEWLEAHFARWNTSPEEVVREEQHRQGGSNLTVRNIITSMRLVSGINWAELVESVSLVDCILGKDSAFQEMDFATRNLYRSAIEELSRGSQVAEIDVARKALALAAASSSRASKDAITAGKRAADPGFYLIADGRRDLESAIGFRVPRRLQFRRFLLGLGIGGYVATTIMMALLVLCLPLIALSDYTIDSRMIALLLGLGLIPALSREHQQSDTRRCLLRPRPSHHRTTRKDQTRHHQPTTLATPERRCLNSTKDEPDSPLNLGRQSLNYFDDGQAQTSLQPLRAVPLPDLPDLLPSLAPQCRCTAYRHVIDENREKKFFLSSLEDRNGPAGPATINAFPTRGRETTSCAGARAESTPSEALA